MQDFQASIAAGRRGYGLPAQFAAAQCTSHSAQLGFSHLTVGTAPALAITLSTSISWLQASMPYSLLALHAGDLHNYSPPEPPAFPNIGEAFSS